MPGHEPSLPSAFPVRVTEPRFMRLAAPRGAARRSQDRVVERAQVEVGAQALLASARSARSELAGLAREGSSGHEMHLSTSVVHSWMERAVFEARNSMARSRLHPPWMPVSTTRRRAPHLVGHAPELLVGVVVDPHLDPEPLGVGPSPRRRPSRRSCGGREEVFELGGQRDLEMVAGDGLVERERGEGVERPALQA